MSKREPKYTFYVMTLECADGKCAGAYRKVKDTYYRWPVMVFANLAEKMGFSQFRWDESIVGGYYNKPGGDESLVCVPYGRPPANFYG